MTNHPRSAKTIATIHYLDGTTQAGELLHWNPNFTVIDHPESGRFAIDSATISFITTVAGHDR